MRSPRFFRTVRSVAVAFVHSHTSSSTRREPCPLGGFFAQTSFRFPTNTDKDRGLCRLCTFPKPEPVHFAGTVSSIPKRADLASARRGGRRHAASLALPEKSPRNLEFPSKRRDHRGRAWTDRRWSEGEQKTKGLVRLGSRTHQNP